MNEMRPFFLTFSLFLATGIVWAQSGEGVAISEVNRYGVITRVTIWATTNVGAPGEFGASPEDYGGYFTFDEAQEACPEGWRTPTKEEFNALTNVESEWVTVNNVNGSLFRSGENSFFLPAGGGRRAARIVGETRIVEGEERGIGNHVNYWSRDGNSNSYGYCLSLLGSAKNKDYWESIVIRSWAFPVRCVRKQV